MGKVSEGRKLDILKNILGNYYKNQNEHLFHCPKCNHHKRKLSVNIEKNVFKCWVCDWSGRNLYRVVRKYGTRSNRTEWRSFNQEVEIRNFAEKLFGEKEEVVEQQINLPPEFVSLVNKNLPKTSVYPLNYLRSRFVNKNDILKWKLGYCSSGKYEGRIIFPSFGMSGQVNYFISRTFSRDKRKYLNPPMSKRSIFNELYLDFDKDLVIVEGVFDAINAGDNAVPLLGSTLTDEHPLFQKIVDNDVPVYLALDADASKKTNKLIELFLRYDIETYLVDVAPYKDVGEMPKHEFLQRKQTSAFLNSDNYLLSKIAGI